MFGEKRFPRRLKALVLLRRAAKRAVKRTRRNCALKYFILGVALTLLPLKPYLAVLWPGATLGLLLAWGYSVFRHQLFEGHKTRKYGIQVGQVEFKDDAQIDRKRNI